MPLKNSYPELPEVPFERTTVGMDDVVAYANQAAFPIEVKRIAYCIFRNESANGQKGVNNNYAGIQADCGRWSKLEGQTGTSVKVDSGGALRRFICFPAETGYKLTFDFLCRKVQDREMYIGAPWVSSIEDATRRYILKWVGVNREPTPDELRSWRSLYSSAKKLIV